MDNSIIAVRIANGSFVKVLDTSSRTRRRLVLTTVRDGQTSVRIDLYRAAGDEMQDAEHISSLTIDDIEAADRGVPDIALLLGVDESGNLNATAIDKKSGESQSLSVNLEPGAENAYDMPDFELSDSELTLDDLSMDEEEISFEEDLSPEGEPGFEEEIDIDKGTDGEEALAGFAEFSDDSVSFDESFALEPEEESGGDTLAESAEDLADEADFDLSVLTDEEGGDEVGEEMFADTLEPLEDSGEDESADELPELGEGLVPADLGEEDFTFDEGELETVDDNLFDEPEEAGVDEPGSEEPFDAEAAFAEPALAESPSGASDFDESDLEDADFGDTEFSDEEFGDAELGEEEGELEDTLSPEEFARLDSEPVTRQAEYGGEEQPLAPRRSNAIIFAGYIILALAALGVLTYLVFRLLEGPPAPPLQASLPLLLAGGVRRPRRHRGGSAGSGRKDRAR